MGNVTYLIKLQYFIATYKISPNRVILAVYNIFNWVTNNNEQCGVCQQEMTAYKKRNKTNAGVPAPVPEPEEDDEEEVDEDDDE